MGDALLHKTRAWRLQYKAVERYIWPQKGPYRKSDHWGSFFFPPLLHLGHHCNATPGSSDRLENIDRRSLAEAWEGRKHREKLLLAVTTHLITIYLSANHVYLPTTSLMALVKTPFSTRVRLTAWGRGKKQQTRQPIRQVAFLISCKNWMAVLVAFLPSKASIRSPRSAFFRKANTRMTISGVNTATHCCNQTKQKNQIKTGECNTCWPDLSGLTSFTWQCSLAKRLASPLERAHSLRYVFLKSID